MVRKILEFELKFGMIQAFGCIDGTHIPLRTPRINSQDNFNYKQFYSISYHAICDSCGLFIDTDCLWTLTLTMQKFLPVEKLMKNLKIDFWKQYFLVLFLGEKKYQTIC